MKISSITGIAQSVTTQANKAAKAVNAALYQTAPNSNIIKYGASNSATPAGLVDLAHDTVIFTRNLI